MERPILASEQVYGGLNLDWEEEEEEENTAISLYLTLHNPTL
jgi:hypothetical protein